MSLINDALRRAKEAQQQAPPPPPAPQFRPVEPALAVGRSRAPLLAITVAALALVTALLIWQLMRKSQPNSNVEARLESPNPAETRRPTAPSEPSVAAPVLATVPPQQLSRAPTPAPSHESNLPLASQGDSRPANSQPPVHQEAPRPAAIVEQTTPSAPIVAATVPVAEPAPAKPPPQPKLQAIVFNPSRPSAMISGRTLFIGDRLGDWRVVAINAESATLVGGGQTNVLSLPQ